MASNRAILLLCLSAILFFLSLSTASGKASLQQKTDCKKQCAQEYREIWKVKFCQIKCPYKKYEEASAFYSISEVKDAQACRGECSSRGLDEPQRRRCERECRRDRGSGNGNEELYTGVNNQRHCRMECSRKRGSKQEQYDCWRRCEEQSKQGHGDNGRKYQDGNGDVDKAALGFYPIAKAKDPESCRKECSGRGLDERLRRRCESDCRSEHDDSGDEKMYAGGSHLRGCSMECKRRGGSKQEQHECLRRCEEQRRREHGDNTSKYQDGTGGTGDKAAMGFYSIVNAKDPERCKRDCRGSGLDEYHRRRCERECMRENDDSSDENTLSSLRHLRDCRMECSRKGGSKQEQYECRSRCEEQRRLGDNGRKHQDSNGGVDNAPFGIYSIIKAKDPERCRRECSGSGLDEHQRRRCERHCKRDHDGSANQKSFAAVNHHMDCRMECSRKGGSKQEQYECSRRCEEQRSGGDNGRRSQDSNGGVDNASFGFYSIIKAKDPERCRRECSGKELDKHQRQRCEHECRREHDSSTVEKSYAGVNHHTDCRIECSRKGGSKQEQYECSRRCEEERRRGHGHKGQVDGNGDAGSIMFEVYDGSKRYEKCFDECQELRFSKQECRKWCKINDRRLEAGEEEEEEEESDRRMEKECRNRCLRRCQELGRCDCRICYKAGRVTSSGKAKW